jgi:hypothetical protein
MIAPIKNFDPRRSLNQFFGTSKSFYQNNFGIPGHNGWDLKGEQENMGFGTPILAAHDGIIESISYDVPHKTSGNGIYLMSLDGKFSTSYWHLASFEGYVGQKIKEGQVMGTMGNSGLVNPKPSPICPHCGTHLHFGLRLHGHTNNYKGFVDPLPYFHQEGWKYNMRFTKDLYIGRWGDDVSWLQSLLKLDLKTKDYEPIGIYGPKTLRDVMAFQRKYNLSPTGYVGYQTKNLLHSKFTIYG